ncbi:MAG: GAF domain-containing protein [Bacteroidia bacterium]|nr:GAF domain-containing protein [Bacteroidia bacterium]
MKDQASSASQKLNLLSETGIDVLSLLSVEEINELVYNRLTRLMETDVFGIGVYNKEKNELQFPAIIEKGIKIPSSISLTEENRPATWCFKNQKVFQVNNYAKEFGNYFNIKTQPLFKHGGATQSIIYYPLIIKEKMLGVITVQSFKENAFSENDIDILKNLSIYISTAINNARIHQNTEDLVKLRSAELLEQKEELQKVYENTRLLSEIGQKISSSLSVDAIIDDTYNSVKDLMHAEIFGIAVTNPTNDKILDFYVNEYSKKHSFILDLTDNTRPGTLCFNEQRVVFMNDFATEIKKINPNYKPLVGKTVGALMYVPLSQKGKRIGIITVQNYEKEVFTDLHVEIVKTLAVYVASAIENAMLYGHMEEEVKRRTVELVKQKEEIEVAYEHIKILEDVGKEITSTLDFEFIFEKLHQSVAGLMSTDVFGVRLYYPEKNCIAIEYEIYNGKRDDGITMSLDNKNNFTVWCIENKKEVLITDVAVQYKNYVSEINLISGEATNSVIFVPILLGEKVLGVLTVQSYQKNQYSEKHLNIIKTLANYAAIALENAEKFEKLNTMNHQIEDSFRNIKVLSEIGQKITSNLQFEKILDTVYEHTNKIMDATEFGVAIMDELKDALHAKYYIFEGKRMSDDDTYVDIACDNRLSAWSLRNKKEVFINDIETEYIHYIPNLDAYNEKGSGAFVMGSLMYLPLIIEDRVIGGISVQSPKKNAYTVTQLDMLRTLASYTAAALNNAEAYEFLNLSNDKLVESYRNIEILGQMGQKITSTLDLETILEIVYTNVKQLMDATEFGVGIFDKEKNIIDLGYYILEGKRANTAGKNPTVNMNDDGRLAVWCVKNKKEVFINDIEEEYIKYIPSLDAYTSVGALLMKSLICLPLIIENNAIGIISVQSPDKNAYSELHLEMFKTIASYAAVALNNAEAYLKLNESTNRLDESFKNIKVLSEIGQKITATLNFDKVLRTVYENVNKLMDASMFAVVSYDESKKELTYQVVIENQKEIDVKGNSFSIETKESLAAWCARNQKEILIGDLREERANYAEGGMNVGEEMPNSLIYIPLIIEKRVIGVLSVQSKMKHAYTQQHVEILRTLAAYSAIALDNALIYNQLNFALREVEKLSVVASKTNNTVIICSPDTEIIWANEAFSKNSGYALEEFKATVGKTLLEISGIDEIKELVDNCIRQKTSVSYESANISKSGEKLWFHTTLTPVFDEEGKIKNIVAIDANITKIKMAEEQLWQKNKDITDSINYALKIQNSILPAKEKIKELLPDSFVFYRPRDIVSGDFYWVEEIENRTKVMVAAIDCTGHGVPGAFLTIVGNSLMNQIVNEQNIINPQEIIIRMNKGIINRLSLSHGDTIRDGMDMALCVFDKEMKNNETEFVFSGAFNPVYYMQAGTMKETPAIRQSIGSIPENEYEKIPCEKISLKKGDCVYFATDGYADQLGGKNGKKFLKGKFKKLLIELNTESMYNRKLQLNKAMNTWKGDFNQTDDILVIGFGV